MLVRGWLGVSPEVELECLINSQSTGAQRPEFTTLFGRLLMNCAKRTSKPVKCSPLHSNAPIYSRLLDYKRELTGCVFFTILIE